MRASYHFCRKGIVITYGKDLLATVSIQAGDVRLDADVGGKLFIAPTIALADDLRDVKYSVQSDRKHFEPPILIVPCEKLASSVFCCSPNDV